MLAVVEARAGAVSRGAVMAKTSPCRNFRDDPRLKCRRRSMAGQGPGRSGGSASGGPEMSQGWLVENQALAEGNLVVLAFHVDALASDVAEPQQRRGGVGVVG